MSRVSTQAAPRQPQAATKTIDPDADILDDIMERTVSNLDKCAEKFSSQLDDPNIGGLRRAFVTGLGVQRLRGMMDAGVMQVLRSLMNTPIGFLTDRGPGKKEVTPYPDEVLRDCAIEATLKGVLWVGNQFNIIAGRCYVTLEGYTHKLDQLEGLDSYAAHPGVPQVKNGGAVVRYGVTWKYRGQRGQLMDADGKPGVEIPVKTDSHSGVDQILGKARRKAFKLAFDTIRGTKSNDVEPDDVELPGAQAAIQSDCITDVQALTLNELIAEHQASAILIRGFYELSNGQRLAAKDLADCCARTKAGQFSAPPPAALAEGEIPNEQSEDDLREWTSDEVATALAAAGVTDVVAVWRRYAVKRAADLTQEQRREIMVDLAQTTQAS